MPIKKILCFGELLIRLQSDDSLLSSSKNNLIKAYPGGSEANVAVTLAHLKVPCSFVSIAPNNAIFQKINNQLNSIGIDTSKIIIDGDRLGTYYLLSANGLSNGEVIYDRNYSSFSQGTKDTFDWDYIFQDIEWFHITAITPALSQNLADICKIALQKAQQKGITISVDLNYRSKLWNYGKSPLEIIPEIIQYADVIMGNIWAAHNMLGTSIKNSLNRETSKNDFFNHSIGSANELFDKFPKCKCVANTFRFMDSPNHNLFYGTYHNRMENVISETFETNEVIDRIGSGDAFMGGLIYALIQDNNTQQIIDIATKAGFNKLFVEGDFGIGKID